MEERNIGSLSFETTGTLQSGTNFGNPVKISITPKLFETLNISQQKISPEEKFSREVLEAKRQISNGHFDPKKLSEEVIHAMAEILDANFNEPTWDPPEKGEITEFYKTHKRKGENALEFFKRVYAKWIGKMNRAHLRSIDFSLYESLNNWSKNNHERSKMIEDILPNGYRKLKDHKISDRDIMSYRKVNSAFVRGALKIKKSPT